MRYGTFVFAPGLVPTVLAAAFLALLVGLGSWQLGRAAEKEALAHAFDLRARQPPIAIRTDPASPDPVGAFTRVSARGAYDTQHQFLLDNRTRLGRAGFHVLTPLRLDDGTGLLVNRGWIPLPPRRDTLPALAIESASDAGASTSVEVRGVTVLPREDQLVLGDTGYDQRTWPRIVQRIELSRMESALGYRLLGFVLALDPGDRDGYLREWGPYVGIGPDRHRGYAVQWFALALTLVVIYVVVNTRRVSGGSMPSEERNHDAA